MKACSIKQPWANLIAHGIKDIENRTWRTNFRGKILIHAPKKDDSQSILFTEDQFYCMHYNGYYHNITDKKTSAIIGTVEIVDCVKNHESIWAEKDCWNWVLKNPVLFNDPILNVKGKLSLWEY
jgi:hypothetical protein